MKNRGRLPAARATATGEKSQAGRAPESVNPLVSVESCLREQRAVIFESWICRGQQFVAKENGIRTGEETKKLSFLSHRFAAGAQTNHRLRHENSRGRDHSRE